MDHPLEFIPQHLRRPMFYAFLALTVFMFGVFRFLDLPLHTDAAPGGIVSFELAGSLTKSQAIIESWDSTAWLYAAFGLGFDYLFMPAYAFALSFGILLAMKGKVSRYATLAAWMGWGVLLAALFDVVENYALWHILIRGAFTPFPQLAAFCATVKFALLIIGLIVALAGRFVKR